MRTLIKRLFLLLALGLIAMLILAWLPGVPWPSAEQRAAVELLRGKLQATDRPSNAYAAYWYFYTDVPQTEAQARLTQDIAALRASPSDTEPATLRLPDAMREPVTSEARTVLCADFRQHDCLAEISERRAAVDSLLARHAANLARAQTLMTYTELRDPTPRGLSAPFPPLGDAGALVFAQAHTQFLDGQQALGIQGVCDWAWHWRQLMGNTDMILGQMVGASTLVRAAPMLTRMLAERAPDVAVAPSCARAFAPLSHNEIDQCEEMAGEFANFDQLVGADAPTLLPKPATWGGLLLLRVTFKADHARGRTAAYLVGYCSAAQRARIAAHETHMPKLAVAPCNMFERMFDYFGCEVSTLQPALEEYYERMIDVDAALRGTSTALWLSEQAQIDAATLAARPAELTVQSQQFELVDDGRALRVHFASTGKRYGEFLDLPIRIAPQ
jgi:hypothetical protein